jgi:hypothetical protein
MNIVDLRVFSLQSEHREKEYYRVSHISPLKGAIPKRFKTTPQVSINYFAVFTAVSISRRRIALIRD